MKLIVNPYQLDSIIFDSLLNAHDIYQINNWIDFIENKMNWI